MSVGWLLLAPGLGSTQQEVQVGGCRVDLLGLGAYLSKPGYCLFEGIQKVVKHEPRPAIHVEKVTVNSSGGPISWVGQSLKGSPGWGKQCYAG